MVYLFPSGLQTKTAVYAVLISLDLIVLEVFALIFC